MEDMSRTGATLLCDFGATTKINSGASVSMEVLPPYYG